jgi:HD-like signal output (HDOD) protein
MASLEERIRTDLELLGDLPSPSPVLHKLSTTLGHADVEVWQIEEIIGQDPVVAGRVVHAANAAAYAAHSPTTTIHNALMRLGVIRVRRLALLASLYNALPGRQVPEGFWPHSLTVASCAEVIARNLGGARGGNVDPDGVFLAALLHDLGLLVLSTHYPREYRSLREAVARQGGGLDEVEDAVLGIDHGAIGERLAAHWLLPRNVCAAIRGHHRPDAVEPEHRHGALMVHLADALCYHVGLAEMGEGVTLGPEDPAIVEFRIDAPMLATLVEEAKVEAERAAEALGSMPNA